MALPEPLILGITVKVMAILDGVLGLFVSSTFQGAAGNTACTIGNFTYSVTPCGTDLIANLGNLVYYLSYLGGNFLAALSATAN